MSKKFGKRFIGSIAAAVLCFSMVTAGASAASSSSKDTVGYGKLRGAISVNSLNDFQITTTVEKNNDNAYLTGSVEWQDKSGNTVFTGDALSPGRGATFLYDFWTIFGSKPHQAFGSHGVQGGHTYGAAAVYTFTVL
ncbi:hypothetical protein ACE3MQ_13410 [Paenibacillus lentus]|uniref:hypothetical protein n=1 Tax=Paenibacillus lentus TaxID=1338368 RepID=UPI00364C74D2